MWGQSARSLILMLGLELGKRIGKYPPTGGLCLSLVDSKGNSGCHVGAWAGHGFQEDSSPGHAEDCGAQRIEPDVCLVKRCLKLSLSGGQHK